MHRTILCRAAACVIALAALPCCAIAQTPRPEDAAIDAMRTLDTIGSGDQRRIGEWIRPQVDRLTATARQSDDDRWVASAAFRETFNTQFDHPDNSRGFSAQLATQTTSVAAREFGRANADPILVTSLARVLVDMNHPETFRALIAGLRSGVDSVRYLCARGLANLKPSIAADAGRFGQAVEAIRVAALAETSPIVLGHLFRALAYTGASQVPTVFDVYIAAFDRRLEARRGGAVVVDGAELEAYEFLRTGGVLGALSNAQKAQLAGRLAVYLRLNAERYNTPDLKFYEIAKIERLLDGGEAILSSPAMLGPNAGGKIRGALDRVGHGGCAEIPPQAYLWVGDPRSSTPGALNSAPWNVPVGAP